MNIKLFILSLTLLLFSITVFSQEKVIDSLENKLKTTSIDSVKVEILNTLGFQYRNKFPKKSLSYANDALSLSISIKFLKGEVNAHNLMGIINKNLGKFDEAIEHYFKALKISEKNNDLETKSSCLNNIGSVYQVQGDYKKALSYFKESQILEEKIGNKKQLSIRLYNIGLIYDNLDSLDLAYSYYYNSLLIEQQINNKEGIYFALYGIAGVDTKRGRYDKAMESITEAIGIAKQINDIAGVSVCFSELGKLFQAKNNFAKSIQYFDSSLYYATKIDFKNSIIQGFKDLSETWFKLGNKDKAYGYLKKYIALNDSTNSIEISNKIAEIETRFEIDKKEKQIQFLKATNALETQKAETEKRNRYFLLITFILSLVLAISNLRRIVEQTRQIVLYVSIIILSLLIVSFIILVSGLFVYEISFYNFFSVFVDVLTIAILPIFITVLILERVLLSSHLKTAKEVSEQINTSVPLLLNETKLNLHFENETDLSFALKDLICIEANDNYSAIFYYKDGKHKKELYRVTLKKLEEQLAQYEDILRCHKSYIINITHIKRISGNAQGFKLHFQDLTFDIPVSRKIPREIIDKIKSRL